MPPRRNRNVWPAVTLILTLAAAGQDHLKAQVVVKWGVAWSGFRASHSDQRIWYGEDYRPFLGYEVDAVQDGDAHPALRLQFGVASERRVSRGLGIQAELHLALRGVGWEQAELYGEAFRVHVAYAQIPLFLKVRAPDGWALRPNLLLGGFGALRLRASRTVIQRGATSTEPLRAVRTLDYGVVCALENQFSVSSRRLSLEVRLEWGLGSAMTQPPEFTDLFDDPGKVNVVALSVLAGWSLGS